MRFRTRMMWLCDYVWRWVTASRWWVVKINRVRVDKFQSYIEGPQPRGLNIIHRRIMASAFAASQRLNHCGRCR